MLKLFDSTKYRYGSLQGRCIWQIGHDDPQVEQAAARRSHTCLLGEMDETSLDVRPRHNMGVRRHDRRQLGAGRMDAAATDDGR